MPWSWRNSARPAPAACSATSWRSTHATSAASSPGHGLLVAEHGHLEVEDHEVVRSSSSSSSAQPMQRAAHALEAGLLPQLAGDGLGQGLARSTRPPGTAQSPWAGPRPRRTSSRRSSSTTTAPTASVGAGSASLTAGSGAPRWPGPRGRSVSKKFLVWRSPGRARLSTPMQPGSAHQRDERVHQRLADADPAGRRVDVEVGDHAEAAAVGELVDAGHAVARSTTSSSVPTSTRCVGDGRARPRDAASYGRVRRRRSRAQTSPPRRAAAPRRPARPARPAAAGRRAWPAAALLGAGEAGHRASARLELGDLRQDRLAAPVGQPRRRARPRARPATSPARRFTTCEADRPS